MTSQWLSIQCESMSLNASNLGSSVTSGMIIGPRRCCEWINDNLFGDVLSIISLPVCVYLSINPWQLETQGFVLKHQAISTYSDGSIFISLEQFHTEILWMRGMTLQNKIKLWKKIPRCLRVDKKFHARTVVISGPFYRKGAPYINQRVSILKFGVLYYYSAEPLHSIQNHVQLDSLFNSSFNNKESIKAPLYCLLVDFPDRGSVMRKALPCHDVIMQIFV